MAERPLSPHLQVYRLPLTAIISISHRLTGIALGGGLLLLVWWLVAAAEGRPSYETAQWFLESWVGSFILIGFAFALSFHMLGGIRHLIWTAGYGFDKATSQRASAAIVVGAIFLTVVIWLGSSYFSAAWTEF